MGHASSKYICEAGLPATANKFYYVTCAATKLARRPVGGTLADGPLTTQFTTSVAMEKLYVDLIGPFNRSFRGFRYALRDSFLELTGYLMQP